MAFEIKRAFLAARACADRASPAYFPSNFFFFVNFFGRHVKVIILNLSNDAL